MFVDTDLIITKSYFQFLFGKVLIVEPWIEDANKSDLYLFLEPDCEYIQDGTRLSIEERNALSDHHKMYFNKARGIPLTSIKGTWEDRYQQAIDLVEQLFFHKKAAANQ